MTAARRDRILFTCLVMDLLSLRYAFNDISISFVNHSGAVIVGKQYELQCIIQNVDPSKSVVVRWYKRSQTNSTDANTTSVSNSSKLQISPSKTDNGAQYWCEVEGTPPVSSELLKITVHYKPIINKNKLPSTVTVFRGYPEVLVCEADGNPKPTISWSLGVNDKKDSEKLNITESTPENVSCTANNSVGSDIRHVKVILKDISISFVNHSGAVIVGKQYELQCIIQNVNPSKSVVVRWYKRSQTNSTDANTTSVSNSSKLQISPSKTDNGAQYWCEAGTPPVSSELLKITVHYKPIINKNKLPSTVPVFRGYPEVLVCEADGNPKPTISWSLGVNDSEKLNITESTPENVSCTANNSVGSDIRHVKVILKEDYLPLIAGLIAVIVAFISVIFIFIFSIYYKTAKMGHYNLKNAKPSAQNGNIAQNGKHNTFPMKKLSQSSILA